MDSHLVSQTSEGSQALPFAKLEPGRVLTVMQVCSAQAATYGAAVSMLTLSNALRKAGHRVLMVPFAGRAFGEQLSEMGFEVFPIRVRGKLDPLAIFQLSRLIRKERVDLVHAHLSTSSLLGAMASRLAKVPSVSSVHGLSNRWSYCWSNHLIAVSQEGVRHLQKQGVSPKKLSVVYNGIKLNTGHLPGPADAIREELGLNPDTFVVGTISRVTALKGIEDALYALALFNQDVRDWAYLVVGDGRHLSRCKKLAQELGIDEKVKFLGYREDARKLLPSMDVFLFPTHKEAMGIVLIEAMASGLPVIATKVGGIPEVVDQSCGLLVPSRSPQELYKALMNLYKDSELRESFGAAGKARVQDRFTEEEMLKSTLAVYQQIIGL